MYPSLFPSDGLFGRYPYLLPCLIAGSIAAVGFLFGLKYLVEPAKFKAAQDKWMKEAAESEMEEARVKEEGLAAADALGEWPAEEQVNGSSSVAGSKTTWCSARFAAVSRQAWLVITMCESTAFVLQ